VFRKKKIDVSVTRLDGRPIARRFQAQGPADAPCQAACAACGRRFSPSRSLWPISDPPALRAGCVREVKQGSCHNCSRAPVRSAMQHVVAMDEAITRWLAVGVRGGGLGWALDCLLFVPAITFSWPASIFARCGGRRRSVHSSHMPSTHLALPALPRRSLSLARARARALSHTHARALGSPGRVSSLLSSCSGNAIAVLVVEPSWPWFLYGACVSPPPLRCTCRSAG